jgi:hypothetical protein
MLLVFTVTRAGIHEACLHKKTDLKVNSFQTLFIEVFLGVYPSFYRTDFSTITVQTYWWIFPGVGASFDKFFNRYKLLEMSTKAFKLVFIIILNSILSQIFQNQRKKIWKMFTV